MAGADAWLARMQPLIRTTARPGLLPDRGQFAGLFRLAARHLRDPVLVSSTDGVGTKLTLAERVRDYEAIGVDVVAMNTNDVVTYGAEPLFFLDYLAIGKLEPARMSALMRGIVRGCRQSGCALLGGETAEMPGVYRNGDYDVAGFCVGVVERTRLIDGCSVRADDAIVGLASSGVHANGFSLVRRALSRRQLARMRRQLLVPTRIYVKPVLAAMRHVSIRAIAHITGGGLTRRIPGLVSAHRALRARLWPGRWPVPPVFGAIQQAGRIATPEMMATFNMGIGMALVCRPHETERLIRILQRSGVAAWPIGMIERARR